MPIFLRQPRNLIIIQVAGLLGISWVLRKKSVLDSFVGRSQSQARFLEVGGSHTPPIRT